MTTLEKETTKPSTGISLWVSALIPLIALILMLVIFAFGNPLALFSADLPPVEQLSFERVRVVPDGFEMTLVNGGPDPVKIAQVMVDDAYWQFEISPDATIPRLGRAKLRIPYPWVTYEPNAIAVVTQTGLTFHVEVPIAVLSPTLGLREFLAYGMLGVYVGIVPVVLGMLWFPTMKKLGRRWLGAILALTVGLLVFLLLDTFLEAVEMAGEIPGVFQGIPLALFAALLTWMVLLAVGNWRATRPGASTLGSGLYLATLIALGIGLHNLGEGLAIGAAFAIGEVALGSFLVVGFMLHNVTEGVGIAAPLLPASRNPKASGETSDTTSRDEPGVGVFFWLALLAGAPAMLGAWIGGFAFSPLLATVFMGVGVGAIWQVIVEVAALLRRYAKQEDTPLVSWPNVLGFAGGLAIMYLTAFLVKF